MATAVMAGLSMADLLVAPRAARLISTSRSLQASASACSSIHKLTTRKLTTFSQRSRNYALSKHLGLSLSPVVLVISIHRFDGEGAGFTASARQPRTWARARTGAHRAFSGDSGSPMNDDAIATAAGVN